MSMTAELLDQAPPSTVIAMARLVRAIKSPAHAALITRSMNAVADAVPSISVDQAQDAAGGATNYDVLLSILEQPEVLDALRRHNPLASALVRGLHGREELLQAEGGAVTAREAARLLGVTRQSVDNRRRAHRLIGLSLGRRGYAYPVWQFAEGGLLPGLDAVLAALARFSPWMQAQFMVTGDVRLGGQTPLGALRAGQIDRVVRAAVAFGEHGAS